MSTLMDRTYTAAEVAEIERVNVQTIQAACREGRMPGAYRTDGNAGHWRIPESAIIAYRERNKVQPVAPDVIEPRRPRDRLRKRLSA